MIRFAELASDNLDFALPLLGAVAEPIAVDKQVVAGDSSELDSFAIAVAATVTLMFVTVLLVAGSLALEREENAFARVTRGLVGPGGLLVEKVAARDRRLGRRHPAAARRAHGPGLDRLGRGRR